MHTFTFCVSSALGFPLTPGFFQRIHIRTAIIAPSSYELSAPFSVSRSLAPAMYEYTHLSPLLEHIYPCLVPIHCCSRLNNQYRRASSKDASVAILSRSRGTVKICQTPDNFTRIRGKYTQSLCRSDVCWALPAGSL